MTRDHRPPPNELPPPPDLQAEAGRSIDVAVAGPADVDRSAELVSRIRGTIRSSPNELITFAQYMALALYDPQFGYYRQPVDRPTDAGDFLTAPETHPIFGWTVARRIEAMWEELGRPRPFNLFEDGSGSGTLGLSILQGFHRHGRTDILEAVRYTPSESNEYRQTDLLRRFEEAGLTQHLLTPGTRGGTGVVLANEYLDALPVHRVVVQGGELRELYVTWIDEPAESGSPSESGGPNVPPGRGLVEVVAEPSTPDLATRLAEDGVVLAEGQVAEICPGLKPWLKGSAIQLARGYVLVIDYGYEAAELYGPRHLAGTLLGYRDHTVETDPFAAPGQTDLTAHVDFTAVSRLAAGLGFRTVSLTTQSEFLVAAGLEEELRALQASPDLTLTDYARARSGIVRMLDPRRMGGFKVLTLERGVYK